MMKIVCAWCGKHMGWRGTEVGITHGMCVECFDEELERMEAARERKQAQAEFAKDCKEGR